MQWSSGGKGGGPQIEASILHKAHFSIYLKISCNQVHALIPTPIFKSMTNLRASQNQSHES